MLSDSRMSLSSDVLKSIYTALSSEGMRNGSGKCVEKRSVATSASTEHYEGTSKSFRTESIMKSTTTTTTTTTTVNTR
jgi:hypothetical protein